MAGLQIILNAGEATDTELAAVSALIAVMRDARTVEVQPLPLFETPAVPVGAANQEEPAGPLSSPTSATLPAPPTPVAAAVPPPPAVSMVSGEDAPSSVSSDAVPLPPVVSVPAAPAAPPPALNTAGVDSSGMPWDARIHSTPPTKKADGNWRRRRGVDDGTVATVEAELRGPLPDPVSVPLPPAPPVAAAPPPPPPPPTVPTPPVSPAPAATVPPPANAAASAGENPFLGLIRFIQEGEKAGRLTHAQVGELREQFRQTLPEAERDSLATMQGFMPNGAAHGHIESFQALLRATFGG